MICIDASVFVASLLDDEENYTASRRFVAAARVHEVRCPSLLLPECAGALRRRAGGDELARQAVSRLVAFPSMYLVPLSDELAKSAAAVAAEHALRGADAVYVATAVQEDAVLVTWDREMLERGAALVTTQTPEEWLAAQG